MSRHLPLHAALLAFAAILTGCASVPAPDPSAGREPPEGEPSYKFEVYSLRPGDTLASIGRQFGVSAEAITRANSLSDGCIRPGQVLLIPVYLGAGGPGPAAEASPDGEPAGGLREVPRERLHGGRPLRRFWRPTEGRVVRPYGARVRGFTEPGIGIAAPAGTEVSAVADGRVICCVHVRSGRSRGWGNVVAVRHSDDTVSWYAQLGEIAVREGQHVEQGERIGTVGSSGAAARPELALRFFRDERPIDPSPYLP